MTTPQLAPPAPRHPAPTVAADIDSTPGFPPRVQAHLDAADRHLAAGDDLPGSAELWQASFCALQMVAAQRGWACETMDDCYDVINRLAEESDDPYLIRTSLGAPELFYYNAEYDFLETDEISWFGRQIPKFIARLFALTDTPE